MKTKYQKPEIETIQLDTDQAFLAASLSSIGVGSDAVTSSDAKGNNWGDDDDSEW